MSNNGNAIFTDGDKGIDLVADVYSILGLQTNNYDLGYAYFNEHGKINQDSLIKPIYTSSGIFVPVSDFEKYNYGYAIPYRQYNTFAELLYATQNEVWILNEPVKGRTYANLTHFNGYDHNAKFNGWGKIEIEPNSDREELYLHIVRGSQYSTAVCPERFKQFQNWNYAYLLCRVVDDTYFPYYAGCIGKIGGFVSIPTVPIQTGRSYVAIHFICQESFEAQNVEGLNTMPWYKGSVLIPNYKEKGFCISEVTEIAHINRDPNYTITLTATVDKTARVLDYTLSIINLNEKANPVNTGQITLTWYLTTDPLSVTGATYRKRQIAQIILDSVLVQGAEPILVNTGQISFVLNSDEVFIQCEYSDSAIKPSNIPADSTLRWRIE